MMAITAGTTMLARNGGGIGGKLANGGIGGAIPTGFGVRKQ
jgi:hypothetical protein